MRLCLDRDGKGAEIGRRSEHLQMMGECVLQIWCSICTMTGQGRHLQLERDRVTPLHATLRPRDAQKLARRWQLAARAEIECVPPAAGQGRATSRRSERLAEVGYIGRSKLLAAACDGGATTGPRLHFRLADRENNWGLLGRFSLLL